MKESNDVAERTDRGIAFRTAGAAHRKERDPKTVLDVTVAK